MLGVQSVGVHEGGEEYADRHLEIVGLAYIIAIGRPEILNACELLTRVTPPLMLSVAQPSLHFIMVVESTMMTADAVGKSVCNHGVVK